MHGQAGPTRLRHGLTRTRPTLGAAPVNVSLKTVTPQGLTPTIGWCPAVIRHTLGRWLTYYAAIGALSVLGVLEWPVALVLAAGHALTADQHNRAVQQFGEALEDS